MGTWPNPEERDHGRREEGGLCLLGPLLAGGDARPLRGWLALVVTNHYRKRISYSLWRRLHYLNFAVWIAATIHGLGAGTDTGSTAFLIMYTVTAGAIAALALRRFVPRPVVSPGTPTAASAGTRSQRTRA
jgi:hypothetical protein